MGNWDFDGDEGFFFLLAAIIALIGIYRWYKPLARLTRLGRPGPNRLLLAFGPPISLAGLIFVLTHWADPNYVVGHLDFQLLFFSGGLMWLWLIGWTMPLLGISVRDDALERNNLAAIIAISGHLFGASLIYAGANIGAGPTIWTTIVPATVATLAWLILAFIVELIARPSESIAIDLDIATALRQAAFLIATALVLARAAAGDWTSWASTFDQLKQDGWPAILLAAIVIPLHFALRPTPTRARPSLFTFALIPSAFFIAAAIGFVVSLGPADIGKHIITFEQYTHQQ